MANGEWRMANGEWRMANGEWRMANGGRWAGSSGGSMPRLEVRNPAISSWSGL
jgi:hypothetical protein